MNSLKELILLHFRSFFREPAVIFWALLFPILMAWVLGIAFTEKPDVKRKVYVTSNVPDVLKGVKVFGQGTGNNTTIEFISTTEEEAIKALKKGVIALYINKPDNKVSYHFDPSNPDAQLLHLIIERELSGLKSAGSEVKPLTTAGTRYIDFLIPGLIALGIMNSCLWGISWNLIEFRMKKLLRRMIATPMRKSLFLTSHIFTRLIFSIFETVVLLVFAIVFFNITITGNIFSLIAVMLTGVFAFAGIGILTASRTSNSQVGNGLINAVSLPMTILSGVFFNYHNFPDWAIPVIKAFPLTVLADSIRSVFIEAAGWNELIIPIGILFAIGTATTFIGLKIFKWH